ncbi:hypothetical protein CGCSCA1_v012953 [Colletotrichum siamense]|nr:hypothetical protein CGCSCA1_v012953 [Colletotrichum siamense]
MAGVENTADKKARFGAATETIDSFVNLKEAELECARERSSVLRKSWSEGNLEIPNGKYYELLEESERDLNSILGEVATLRSEKNKIVGELTDISLFQQEVQAARSRDWSYIDLLISRYLPVHGAVKSVKSTNSDARRPQFRKALIEASGSLSSDGKSLWCPISKAFWPAIALTAGHVVKVNVGDNVAFALFGTPEDEKSHIWSKKNGILMLEEYEEAWDAGRFVIVPKLRDDGSEDETLKIIVLDRSLLDEKAAINRPWGKALDGLELQFKTNLRPLKRYLYFKFVMTMLRRQRGEAPGAAQDRYKAGDIAKKLWMTPGGYLKDSTLYALSRQAGVMEDEKAIEFWNLMSKPEPVSELAEEVSKTLALTAELGMSLPDEKGKGGEAASGNLDDEEIDE